MLVTNLEDMERIISSRSDLQWEGWNVVKYTNSSNAMYSKDAEFKNGKWMKKTIFALTEEGWHLPNSIGREYEQVEG